MDEQPKNPYRRAPRAPEVDRKPARVAAAEPSKATDGPRKGLRQLPNDLRDLANGKVDRLRRPNRAPSPLDDDREGAVIPGVRNLEARAVYDARVVRLRADLAASRTAELADGLRQVRQLALWRARNVTDFRAFAENVVGVPAGTLELPATDEVALPPEAVALLIRVEAALLQRPPQGQARLLNTGDGLRLELSIPIDDVARAVECLSDLGRGAAALRRFLRPDAQAEPSRSYGTNNGPRRPAREAEGGSWRGGGARRERPADGPRRAPPRFQKRDDRPRPPKRRKP